MKLKFTLFICLFAFHFASAVEPPAPPFDDAEQDKQGLIWTLSRQERGQLHTFDGQHWATVSAPFSAEDTAMPLHFLRLPDGAVACLWNLTNDRLAITTQLHGESRLFAVFPAKLQQLGGIYPHLLLDSHSRYWITGSGPQIHRIDPDAHVGLSYEIQPDQLLKATLSGHSYNPLSGIARHADGRVAALLQTPEPPPPLHVRTAEESYNSIYAVEDGRGRIWAWSNTWGTNWSSLDGVLIFDGGKTEQRRQLKGITGTMFSVIVKKDEKHMWVAVPIEGLFEVDIDTLEAKPVGPDSQLLPFERISMIFPNGEAWYVIASGLEHKGDLWCLRGGKWTQVLSKMDVNYRDIEAVPNRAILLTEKGFIIRSFDAAPWFISEDAAPARLDWQSGFPTRDTRKIFRLTDGTLFALGPRGQIFHGDVELPPKPAATTRVTELQIADGWCVDDNGHVWSMIGGKPNSLSEWDGEHWLPHEIPSELQHFSIGAVTIDTHGRIWLLPNQDQNPAAYIETANGKWHAFPKIEDAYQSVKNDPPHFERDHMGSYALEFSPDGKRMAFRSKSQEVVYFDGSTWHRWKRGPEFAPGGNMLDAPFFAADGHLCTTILGDAWQLDDDGKWQQLQAAVTRPASTPAGPHYKLPVEPPEGCVTNSPESIALDNEGAFWLTWQGKLYKCLPGACIEVFSKGEQNPFADGRRIQDAWVDRRGNVFFKTGSYTRTMVAPRSPAPKVSIVVEHIAGDSVTARFGVDPQSEVQFRWKLDAGEWQSTKEKILALDSLANGTHTLSATAIDGELQSSAVATAKFEIKIDPDKQMADLIQQLADPDYAKRKSAVAALARQPALALPALKTAREKAGDGQSWWIDVAIQEAEDQSTKGKSAPTK